jgi:uncharacterized membrane protein YciS (DUF1049 family)
MTAISFTVGLLAGWAICTAYSDRRIRLRIEHLEQTNPRAAQALAEAFADGWEP